MSVASSSSAHTESAYVLAAELSPIPKQTHITAQRMGARGRTAHITGSPHKDERQAIERRASVLQSMRH